MFLLILLAWHISIFDDSFLFGGINYELRDRFDSYCNNLISIIKEGFDTQCKTINFGQNSIKTTAEFIIKNKIPAPKFYVLTPLPGTDFYKEMKKKERLSATAAR